MYRVALVVPALTTSGGVATVADFLYRVLDDHPDFEPDLVSIATKSNDPLSTHLRDPTTWGRRVQTEEGTWRGRPYTKVGARLVEFEFQRYLPRPELTQRLNRYDLVQIVAGAPAWAYTARDVDVPVALQVATLVKVERSTREASLRRPIDVWRWLMTFITSRIEQKALPHVDAVFVENDWMRRWMSECLSPQQVVFAPPGVDEAFFRPASESNEEADYLLSVGRFGDPRKNLPLLFSAYAQVREKIAGAPNLVLAGRTPPDDAAWEHARRLGIDDAIEFRENIPYDELARLYRQANLFILSSNEEGLGLVVLEAMSSGTAVVSTNCGGPSTLIEEGETGYLVPVNDAEALADRIVHLLRHPESRRAMGRRGRERVERHFSQKAAGRRFTENYHSLLESE